MDDLDDSEDEISDDDSEDETDKELSSSKKKISSEAQFTRRLTQYYDLIGCYFPVLLRLRELAKLSAISIILKNTYNALEEGKKNVIVPRNDSRNMLENIRRQINYPICTESKVNIIPILNRKTIKLIFSDPNKSRSTSYIGKPFVLMV